MLGLAVVCLAVALVAAWARYRTSRYYRLLSRLPGPRGVPFLGNTLDVNKNIGRFLDYSKGERQRYGCTFVEWLGPYGVVGLTDPRDVEIVLNNTATLSKSAIYRVPALFLGYGLLTAKRSDWKRYHRIMAPAFVSSTLASFLPVINGKSRALVDALRKHQNGHVFDVFKYMQMCTLDIVTETSLGKSMDVLNGNKVDLVNSLKFAEDLVYYACARPWCWNHTFMKITPSYKAMVGRIKILWDFADDIISKKLARFFGDDADADPLCEESDGQSSSHETKRLGYLEHVISRMKNESILLTKDELKDNTMTVIVGGMDTAAIVMSAALMLLGLHQDVQKKVVDELEQIFGDDIHRDVTNEDLTKMVYLEQVINETLRLYPPLPVLSRAVEEEVHITGYTLPAGTIVLISPFHTQRDAAYFPDPDKFDPDRFSRENSVGRHPYSFFPFLAGRRMCIGKKYAYLQMKTILSTVLRHYEVLPCGSREEMDKVQFRLTLHIVSGSNIKLITRR